MGVNKVTPIYTMKTAGHSLKGIFEALENKIIKDMGTLEACYLIVTI